MSTEEFDVVTNVRSPMPPPTDPKCPPVRRRRGAWMHGSGSKVLPEVGRRVGRGVFVGALLAALGLLLAGCNPWQAHYTRLQSAEPLAGEAQRRPVLEKVDIESLSAVNVPEGWALIGYSEWEGTTPATLDLERSLERFALEQGAERVLWGWRYARRAARTDTVPLTSETRTRTVISGGRSEARDTSTTTTEWVAQTTEEDRFQYRALLLVREHGR